MIVYMVALTCDEHRDGECGFSLESSLRRFDAGTPVDEAQLRLESRALALGWTTTGRRWACPRPEGRA